MKKNITILAIGFFIPFFIPAQDTVSIELPATGITADPCCECPKHAVFNQAASSPGTTFVNAVNSFPHPQILYDNFYGVTGPIVAIRYWGYINNTIAEYPVEYRIEFFTDDNGKPGSLVNSYILNLSPGTDSYAGVYKVFDIQLPSEVNLSEGWIGINACDNRFGYQDYGSAWLGTANGDDLAGFRLSNPDIWYPDPWQRAFCLVGKPLYIPISNWAIGLGIFLIFLATMARFIKK